MVFPQAVMNVFSKQALDAVRIAWLMIAEQRPRMALLSQNESTDYDMVRARVLASSALAFLERLEQAEQLLPEINGLAQP